MAGLATGQLRGAGYIRSMKLPIKLPEHLMVRDVDLMVVGKRLLKEVGEDDVSGAAAELAYRFFLAVFPFFIFLAAMGGFVADILGVTNPTQEIMAELQASLPADAATLLRGELETIIESRDAGLVSLGILGAVWAASSGVGTIMKALNRIHEVKETRPLWTRYGLAIGLTLLGGSCLVAGVLLMLGGQLFGMEVAARLGIEGPTATLIAFARWPLVLVFLLTALAFLYWAAPNIDLPFKWLTPGAVIAGLSWVVMSFLFGLYVANFGSYNATYGTLGGVVITLIWFYLSGFVLLLGAEINSVLAQEVIPEKLAGQEGATSETVPAHRRGEVSGVPTARASGPLTLIMGALVALLALRSAGHGPGKSSA